MAYELLFDLILLAALWPLRNRLRPRGMFFALYAATYSIGRFFISFLREEYNTYFGGLNEAQIVALIVIIITVPLLVWKAQIVKSEGSSEGPGGPRLAWDALSRQEAGLGWRSYSACLKWETRRARGVPGCLVSSMIV